MKTMQKKIEELREEAAGRIRSILFDHRLEDLYITDIDEGNSPVVHWGYYEEDTFTLDKISVGTDGVLYFDSSSAYTNESNSEFTIPLEALVDIVDFLEEHEDEINEL